MSALRDALCELPDAVFADVLESEDAYLVVLDLPGATAETVELRVEGGVVQVDAETGTAVPPAFELVTEGRDGEVSVELPVPMDATGTGAEASVDRGVLELTLPRRSDESVATIPVDEP